MEKNIDTFAIFCTKYYENDLKEILTKKDAMQHYSVIVNFVTFFEDNSELGDAILCESEKTLPLLDEGLVVAQKKLLEKFEGDESDCFTVKYKVHVRITGLPPTDSHRTVFPRNDQLGNFLLVSGTVVKATLPKLLEYKRDFKCSKCGTTQTVDANFNLSHALVAPPSCPSLCLPAYFTVVKNTSGEFYKDYQEVKVQEDVGKVTMGSMPSSIWVTMDNDLVDSCHPGDHITVCGTAMRRWRGLHAQSRGDVELVVKANNVQVSNDMKTNKLITDDAVQKFHSFWESFKMQPLVGRDVILASFCPDVYGLYLVKLAMCIVLAGGVPRKEEGGSFTRAESHLLLVGDPGTGKSHLLRFAAKTSARSVLTTGVGSTSAGLTVCAVREGSDWQLEAGALVLADGGICCIDELNSIREQDRTSIHEAMEQQTISVAKAGMVTKLSTRCSILAATNAKGGYDPEQSISVNVALASPLLSRFDLVLVLQDTRSQDWDRLLSNFILKLTPTTVQTSSELWSLETLQSYFAHVKSYHPVITQDANTVLTKYYQAQRSADTRNAARTTVRMLESLVRLSQGHAKLMMRNEVTLLDAIVAITLVECSMQGSSLIASANALHASFPDDPHTQYRRQMEMILKKLNLITILNDELARLQSEEFIKPSPSTEKPAININEKPSGQHFEFSQRLTDVLTGIRKKRDRDICKAATLNEKRKLNAAVSRKRKRLRKISESDEETDDKIADIPEEPENSRCKFVEPPCPNVETAIQLVPYVEKVDVVENELPSHAGNSEATFQTPVKPTTTSKKLAAFKFFKSPKPPKTNVGSKVQKPDVTETVPTPNFKKSCLEEADIFDLDNSMISKFNENDLTLNHGNFGAPVGSSTQVSYRSNYNMTTLPEQKDPEIFNQSHISRNNVLACESDLELPLQCGNQTSANSMTDDVQLPNNCKRVTTGDEENAGDRHSTILVPTPLITQPPDKKKAAVDINRLKAFARMGRDLSLSQSQSKSVSQSQQQSSQFSLKEMSWDDLDLEL